MHKIKQNTSNVVQASVYTLKGKLNKAYALYIWYMSGIVTSLQYYYTEMN